MTDVDISDLKSWIAERIALVSTEIAKLEIKIDQITQLHSESRVRIKALEDATHALDLELADQCSRLKNTERAREDVEQRLRDLDRRFYKLAALVAGGSAAISGFVNAVF